MRPTTRRKGGQRVIAPGSRVVIRDEEWLVRRTRGTSTGGMAVHVTGLSELVRGHDAIFLTELDDVTELQPADTKLVSDDSPRYRRSKLYLETLLRRTPPTDHRLYVGHRGAMEKAEYQLVPAAKALAQPRPRILIADGVGLGKTLEVGVLLAELIRRGRGARILVVALKSILAQFQEELWARFTIPLVRLDSTGIERVRSKIPSNMNPFYFFDRAIISIDTLKRDEKYRRFLRDAHWDAIVIDECQNVADRTQTRRGRRSRRRQLAELLGPRCDALILTSATPHDGKAESFASLMNLLDPTAIADPSKYTQDDIRGLYVRRFKKDVRHEVGGSFRDRNPEPIGVAASPEEDAVFTYLRDVEFRTIDRRRKGKGVLFRTTLLKAFLSSPDACASTVSQRLAKKALADDEDAAVRHDRRVLGELSTLVKAIRPARFGKLQALLQLLKSLGYKKGKPGQRVVVFSERIDTLTFLHTQLKDAFGLKAEQVPVFHGTLDDKKQQAAVKDFGTERGKTRILLASDAASEGINLHFFCHWLVHFDVPWSLITLEQRNGRIDRFGQESTPEIRYLLTVPQDVGVKGDLRVLERLIEKEQAAHENLGDPSWLMGCYDPEKEELRVAQAVEGEVSAEEAVPDDPVDDDFLGVCGLDGGDGNDTPERPETFQPPTFFPDDLNWVQQALAELQERDESLKSAVEWHTDADGLTLFVPDDLARRFDYLPPELRPPRKSDAWGLKLTTDRARVQDALAATRQEEGRWPEWQLLWDLHPVAEWLGDRILGLFTRHEAPVLGVPRGLKPGEVVLLFQGVLSNQRSQPVVVEWFGMLCDASGGHQPFPFDELVDLTGLDADLSNPGVDLDTQRLERLVPAAVEAGVAFLKEVGVERARSLAGRLRDEERRVRRWFSAAKARVDDDEQRILDSGRRPTSVQDKEFRRRRQDLQERIDRRQRWIDEGLRTVDAPFLRLVAVLVPSGHG